MIKYLETFFAEKNLPEVFWDLKDNDGVSHHISSTVVLEAIEQAPQSEQNGIVDVIRRIDFENGDVNLYLKHLAGALINA